MNYVSQLRRRGEGEQDVDRAGHHRRCFCCGYHHSRRSHGARLVDRRRRSRGRGKPTERGEPIPQGWLTLGILWWGIFWGRGSSLLVKPSPYHPISLNKPVNLPPNVEPLAQQVKGVREQRRRMVTEGKKFSSPSSLLAFVLFLALFFLSSTVVSAQGWIH